MPVFSKIGDLIGRADHSVHAGVLGKHPAFADHFEMIPAGARAMPLLWEHLYGQGITANIAPWRELPADARLPWDHLLIAHMNGRWLLGHLWESQDGATPPRRDFPLIGALEFPYLPSQQEVDGAFAALADFHSAASAINDEAVLRRLITDIGARTTVSAPTTSIADAASLFSKLNQASAVPLDGQGIHRCLYALSRAGFRLDGAPASASASGHLRLPFSLPASTGMWHWSSFLDAINAPNRPMMLVLPLRASWLDVIVGDATSATVAPIRTGAEQVPLVTTVPYDIDEKFTRAVHDYLCHTPAAASGGAATPVVVTPPTTVRKPAVPARSPSTSSPRAPLHTEQRTDCIPNAFGTPAAPLSKPHGSPTAASRRTIAMAAIVAAAVLVVGPIIYFATRPGASSSVTINVEPPSKKVMIEPAPPALPPAGPSLPPSHLTNLDKPTVNAPPVSTRVPQITYVTGPKVEPVTPVAVPSPIADPRLAAATSPKGTPVSPPLLAPEPAVKLEPLVLAMTKPVVPAPTPLARTPDPHPEPVVVAAPPRAPVALAAKPQPGAAATLSPKTVAPRPPSVAPAVPLVSMNKTSLVSPALASANVTQIVTATSIPSAPAPAVNVGQAGPEVLPGWKRDIRDGALVFSNDEGQTLVFRRLKSGTFLATAETPFSVVLAAPMTIDEKRRALREVAEIPRPRRVIFKHPPVQMLTPAHSMLPADIIYVVQSLGCRLPTTAEWAEAPDIEGAKSPQGGDTDYTSVYRCGTDDGLAPRDFTLVESTSTQFTWLRGNVAELCLSKANVWASFPDHKALGAILDEQNFNEAIRTAPAAAQLVAIGGSAMSRGSMASVPVTSFFGTPHCDLGFRLAFDPVSKSH